DQSTREPSARIVLVVGEAGSGKSRLREELLDAPTDPKLDVLFAAGDPMLGRSPYGLIARALRPRIGEQFERISAAVEDLFDRVESVRIAQFLGELTGCPAPDSGAQIAAARRDPLLMGEQLQRAWIEWLDASAARRPIVLALEDLHWA